MAPPSNPRPMTPTVSAAMFFDSVPALSILKTAFTGIGREQNDQHAQTINPGRHRADSSVIAFEVRHQPPGAKDTGSRSNAAEIVSDAGPCCPNASWK